jgi:hypothetical protein
MLVMVMMMLVIVDSLVCGLGIATVGHQYIMVGFVHIGKLRIGNILIFR